MNKDYENIRRNLDMNVEIYKQLRTSIESLKIKLISENLFFSIVDTAIPSYKPINGSSLNVILKGLLISIFLSILLVITIHLFNFYKSAYNNSFFHNLNYLEDKYLKIVFFIFLFFLFFPYIRVTPYQGDTQPNALLLSVLINLQLLNNRVDFKKIIPLFYLFLISFYFLLISLNLNSIRSFANYFSIFSIYLCLIYNKALIKKAYHIFILCISFFFLFRCINSKLRT